ncbi:MAG TPA: lysophospholipase [Blastocatellia bacterium]|nr:lysophospholipase [Blastocatellia bacterium]
MPFIEETIMAGDGLRLYLRRHETAGARGEVVLVHGFGEHSGRYGALTEHLLANGYAVTAYDQRGHGLSDGLPGHVEDFAEYDDDLDKVIEITRSRAAGRPLFLIGHSMGGLVSLRYLAHKGSTIAGAIISAPLIAVAVPVPAYKLFIARLCLRYAPRMRLKNEINPAHLSRDREVGKAYAADPHVTRKVSPKWFAEATRAMAEVQQWAGQIRTPLLVMHGTADRLASVEATKALFARLGSPDKELVIFEGYYHELFNEPEKYELYERVTAWLSERVSESAV